MNVSSIAMSGMRAATARLEASAENTANAQVQGQVPGADAAPAVNPAATPIPRVYRPIRANMQALPSNGFDGSGGGVEASFQPAEPGYFLTYDPQAPGADADGMIANPNVDLASERLEQMQASAQYRMSAILAQTADEMEQTALDIVA